MTAATDTGIYAAHLDHGGHARCGHHWASELTANPADVTCGSCLNLIAGGNTLGLRHPDWQLKPHGTPGAYKRHYRHGTPVCEPCRQWKNRDNEDRQRRTS